MAESTLKGQKILWEKENLLVTSNFSFFHSVFKRLVLQTHKIQGLFGKGLNLYHTITNFNDLEKAFESIAGKGENAGNQDKFQFFESHPFCYLQILLASLKFCHVMKS